MSNVGLWGAALLPGAASACPTEAAGGLSAEHIGHKAACRVVYSMLELLFTLEMSR